MIENHNDYSSDCLNGINRKDEYSSIKVEVVADFSLSCLTNVNHSHQYHYEESPIDKDQNAIEEYTV